MDALEFIKKRNKMCGSMTNCEDCLAYTHPYQCGVSCSSQLTAEEQVAIVEKWSKEHPIKTRQSEFLKQWPNAAMTNGLLICKPCALVGRSWIREKCKYRTCLACREEFWLQPMEEA